MPYALRMRGGLGTHWKLPSELHVCNPTIVNKKEAKENGVTITRDEVLKIIAQIHTYRSCDTHNDPKALAPSDQKVSSDQKVIGWICNDEHDFHPRHWNDLILSLK
jgi:hypothetical protein